jgi:hypothetical protein
MEKQRDRSAEPAATAVDSPSDRSVFLILLSLYFLVLYPILRANRFYNDDLKRALFGRTGWDSNGRPLTTFVMKLTQCYDHALVDISPLTQIAAIAMLAWLGVRLARRYAIRSPWMAALVALPLGAQPFFLENLSYKFDALSMGLAMLLALLPITTLGNSRRAWWLGVLSIFASLNFYQAAVNALLIFAVADLLLAQLDGKRPRDGLAQFSWRILQIGVAMLIYQLLVGIHISNWVKQHAEMIHRLRDLPLIKTNVVNFYSFIGGSFNAHWWMYFGPALVLLGLIPVAIGIRHAMHCRPNHSAIVFAVLFATSFVLPLVALAFVLGPMLLLVHPLIMPRELMGVGALLSAGLLVMQAALRQWRLSTSWGLMMAWMFAIGLCVFASAYGNASAEQKSYEERIATQVSDDLAELRANRVIHSYLIDGTDGLSPITTHVAEQFPLIHALILPYMTADDVFNTHYFLMSYFPDIADMRHQAGEEPSQLESAILARTCQVPAVRVSSTYNMYLIDDTAVVAFGAAHQRRCTPPARTIAEALIGTFNVVSVLGADEDAIEAAIRRFDRLND